jgi:hypothetical protein
MASSQGTPFLANHSPDEHFRGSGIGKEFPLLAASQPSYSPAEALNQTPSEAEELLRDVSTHPHVHTLVSESGSNSEEQ